MKTETPARERLRTVRLSDVPMASASEVALANIIREAIAEALPEAYRVVPGSKTAASLLKTAIKKRIDAGGYELVLRKRSA